MDFFSLSLVKSKYCVIADVKKREHRPGFAWCLVRKTGNPIIPAHYCVQEYRGLAG